MDCYIYRPVRQDGRYLYIDNRNNFSKVPDKLLDLLGELVFVIKLNIYTGMVLANANPDNVLNCLLDQGYYLQLPPPNIMNFQQK